MEESDMGELAFVNSLDIFYYAWILEGFRGSGGESNACNFDWLFHSRW